MKLFSFFSKKKVFIFASLVTFLLLQFQNCAKSQLTSQTADSTLDSLTLDTQKNSVSQTCSFDGETYQIGDSVIAYLSTTAPYGQTCKSQKRTCVGPDELTGTYNFSFCAVGGAAGCYFNGITYKDGDSITTYQNSTVPYGTSCVSEVRTCKNGVLSGSYAFSSCAVATASSCQFNDTIIANGASIVTYSTSAVAYGTSCDSVKQTRTCNNGNLSGSYKYTSCEVGTAKNCLFNRDTNVPHGGSVTAYSSSSVDYGHTCDEVKEVRTCNNGTLSGSAVYPTCGVNAAKSCSFDGKELANGQTVVAFSQSNVDYSTTCENYKTNRTCNDGTLSGNTSYQYSSCTVNAPLSCNVDGKIVAHGQSVTVYQYKDKSCDHNEVRTCYNGVLNSTKNNYTFSSCSVAKSCTLSGITIKSGSNYKFYHYYNKVCDDYEVRTCTDGTLSTNGSNYSAADCDPACYDAQGNYLCGGDGGGGG